MYYPQIGDIVTVRGRAYYLLEYTDDGSLVCSSCDPNCSYIETLRTFNIVEVEKTISVNNPAMFTGANI